MHTALTEAVKLFLERIEVPLAIPERDDTLFSNVHDIVQSWGIQHISPHHVDTALVGTITAYGHIKNTGTKVFIALFTALVLALDDPTTLDTLDSLSFLQRTCRGRTEEGQSDLLDEFSRILGKTWDFYPRYTASAIFSSALRYISASRLENEVVNTATRLKALPFIEYKRSMTATTEAYACFIWDRFKFPDVREYIQAIPDVMLYVSYANDILSFYKEELAGETGNYIHERSYVSGKPALEVLHELIDETMAAVDRIRGVLGEGEARDAWENFAAGYIRVHTSNPRYRLEEIMGDASSLLCAVN